MSAELLPLFVVLCVALPLLTMAFLGACGWFGVRLDEYPISRIASFAFAGMFLSCVALITGMLRHGLADVHADLGHWFEVAGHEFPVVLVADRLSVPFATFASMLVGLIGVFSRRYIHREPGFQRFYLLLCLFGFGVELVVLAGSIDLVFFGWELVGISSALLIAFFNERRGPVQHGLRAFVTYRACDVGLLAAAIWLHHSAGSSAVVEGGSSAPWSGFVTPGPEHGADLVLVGFMLLWASMGKSAQVPLGGWLPRAMEGPTPSSAIFYGAISIHLGPYLLLRGAPILERAPVVAAAVVVVGLATALHGTFVGRVQTDIKSTLAYASMTQVGLIFAEIGLGLHYLPLLHIVGHATLRSLQILRSPSLLHDHHHLERAMGQQLPRTGGHLERLVPQSLQPWLYRHALERGYFDAWLGDYVVGGFRGFFGAIDRLDRTFARWLSGADSEADAELSVADVSGHEPHAEDAR